jgi:4-amino-4-deoxy-L-arabinose transferase-like glycosyltransferase
MKKTALQVILLLILAVFVAAGWLLANHILQLPFRATNDALHENKSSFNLDFLIPGGFNIDDKITIGEVIKVRARKETSLFERMFQSFSQIIPHRYIYLASGILFFFWFFLYMTFLRIFTFMGYGRALRTSLFLGGCTYYFMPDMILGRVDDFIFIAIPLLIIGIRASLHYRKKRKTKLRR